MGEHCPSCTCPPDSAVEWREYRAEDDRRQSAGMRGFCSMPWQHTDDEPGPAVAVRVTTNETGRQAVRYYCDQHARDRGWTGSATELALTAEVEELQRQVHDGELSVEEYLKRLDDAVLQEA